eukprot:6199987-Pleurochrysis_carterae.AAC.2
MRCACARPRWADAHVLQLACETPSGISARQRALRCSFLSTMKQQSLAVLATRGSVLLCQKEDTITIRAARSTQRCATRAVRAPRPERVQGKTARA